MICSNIIIVDVSGDWVVLIELSVVWKVSLSDGSSELEHVDVLIDLENVIIINISAYWIDLVGLKVVWEISSSNLNKVIVVNVS